MSALQKISSDIFFGFQNIFRGTPTAGNVNAVGCVIQRFCTSSRIIASRKQSLATGCLLCLAIGSGMVVGALPSSALQEEAARRCFGAGMAWLPAWT